MTPVGLEEDGVNLGKVDGFGAISDGFDHVLRTSLISGRVSKLTPGDFGRISTL